MSWVSRPGTLVALAALVAALGAPPDASSQTREGGGDERRPSTPTVLGDTGLWFVPSGEVLPSGQWSVSAFRVNTDRQQGFTDISHFAGSAAIGVKDRLELFGALNAATRIDRDLRPLGLAETPGAGGLDSDYPFVREGFSQGFGDLSLGAKLNLLSEHRGQPAALAVRSLVKLPTGDTDKGVSTGEADVTVDAIASKYVGPVEVAGFGGGIVRGDAPGVDLPNGVRWGVGAGFPAPARLRVVTEVRGEVTLDDNVIAQRPLVSRDGSLSPLRSLVRNPVDALLGVTFQAPGGMFVGAGVSWAARFDARDRFGLPFEAEAGDRFGFQMGLGYRPGRRVSLPRRADPPTARGNQGPAVVAQCDPCRVAPGRTARVTATGTDPDGDLLNYRWHAPAGRFDDPIVPVATWTAPADLGPVVVTVEVDDDHGGRAADSVTLHVVAGDPVVELVFEDVHFDFDRYTLRPAAHRVLDEAVAALQASPGLVLTIDGHTCNIGTAEYNIALADRRATAVREYLVSQGVAAARLQTIAYGEERPGHDNGREETRRLNRRAALVVELAVAADGQ